MKSLKIVLAAALAMFALNALGQGYPGRPVRVVVTFSAGSATDIVARVVMQKVSEFWSQPILVENRGGAGGSIGTAMVAKAAPDGYTLLVNSSAHSANPAIYAHLPYDTAKDFIDIAPLAVQPNVLVVGQNSPFKTLKDLIDAAKAKPGAINFGSAGVGSGTHLNLEKFLTAAGIKVTHIPFKGTPEVIAAILSNSVDCYWAPISAGLSNIKNGKVRALAVSTIKRNVSLPDVPTAAEAGVPGFDFPLWFGLWAPAGVPADIVAKISKDVNRALESPDVRERLGKLGNDIMIMNHAEFSRFVHNEIEGYARIIKAAGIKPQ